MRRTVLEVVDPGRLDCGTTHGRRRPTREPRHRVIAEVFRNRYRIARRERVGPRDRGLPQRGIC